MDDKNGVILQLYSRARAPNRDYYGLTISNCDVTLNTWNITHGPHVFPKKHRCSLDDLEIAKSFLSDIQRLFGLHVANYCIALGRGDSRLECLPTKIFLKILKNLSSNDILKLGRSSKILYELCNRNDVWGILFNKRNKGLPTRDEVKQAATTGWKNIIRNKILWSHKTSKDIKQKGTAKPKKEVTKPAKPLPAPQIKKEIKKEPVRAALQKSIESVGIRNPKEIAKAAIVNPAKAAIINPRIDNPIPKRNVNEAIKQNLVIPNNIPNEVPKVDNNSFQSRSLTALPRKGILKKSNHTITNAITKDQLTSSAPLEDIPEKANFVSSIACQPMTHEELRSLSSARLERTTRINSLINGLHLSKELMPVRVQTAQDRRLDRFLADLDERTAVNPYKLDSKIADISKKVRTPDPIILNSSTLKNKPLVEDFLTPLKSQEKFSTSGKMTTKFEDYLATIKRNMTDKKVDKPDIIPKISELTRSINELRSNFYSSDKLKIKMSKNLNNTKVTNQNGRSQQLNNKLNNIVPKSTSASNLVMKHNALKLQSKSTVSTLPVKPVKVKNTNCTITPARIPTTPFVKPTNASKMPTKNNAINHLKKV